MEKRPGAARRLAAWNDGAAESCGPLYGPDALDWQLDLRFILAEFKEIETEAVRITKGYEALNGIIASMRSLRDDDITLPADEREAIEHVGRLWVIRSPNSRFNDALRRFLARLGAVASPPQHPQKGE